MKTIILDGRKTREELLPELKARIKAISEKSGNLSASPITLAIIQVGNRPDSASYIRAKKSFAEKVGVAVEHIQASDGVSQKELLDIVNECNGDAAILGLIVQLPLPLSLDLDAVIDAIHPGKDVDGLTASNVKRWMEGREDSILPATARGLRELLKHYDIELFGKKVTVIGRSMLVGKPIAFMCLNENATVTVCHSKTPELESFTRQADIVICAAGQSKLITGKHVRDGQVVVDVGINTVEGGKLEDEISGTKLVGDVDFDAVAKKVSAISPVPGGVGPMTVFALFENFADLCLK